LREIEHALVEFLELVEHLDHFRDLISNLEPGRNLVGAQQVFPALVG